ncbi:MAG: hypothetical protein IJO18_01865 [Alphaproteobacteria bacterium]|nr:hypothetical protein [Alphaproteobacteria bacterium]
MVQNRVEPPILMSRLMTFVLATAVVVLAVMLITLYKMFPLNRPQVFFLMTQPSHQLEITLRDMVPADENLSQYKRAFIKEYIKVRNEISSNINVMRKKWTNDPAAAVRAWSTDDVFNDFAQTRMWTALMNEVPGFELKCPVEFETGAITPRGNDMYAVKFRWFCENSDGQVDAKDYTIVLRLESGTDETVQWTDRLNNPLGIRVTQYTVESVDGDKSNKTDPLNRF